MRFLKLSIILLVLVPLACNDDNKVTGTGEVPGELFVTVLGSSAQVVKGAVVRTSPSTVQVTTDALGTVLIEDVPPGTYEIVGTHPSIGSGKSAATVEAGKVTNVTVRLVAGVFLQPQVDIFQPGSGSEFSVVDSILVRAQVMDAEDNPEDLALVWRSSLEGELSTQAAAANGIAELRLASLGMGSRWISLTATDSDTNTGSDSVLVTIRSFSPEIAILQPAPGESFAPGEAVTFAATVTDRETPANQLQIQWASDLDGVLNTDGPSTDGSVSFTTSMLSRGVHEITIQATDADQNTTSATQTVQNDLPERVVLDPLTKDAGGISLSWARITDPDFDSFRIYRATNVNGPYQLINILNDALAVDYRDTDISFGQMYWYQVGLRTTGGQESKSNVESITAGISIDVATQVETMMVDPTRPYLYALDRINNSLLFVNLNTNAVEKTIFVGSSPVDMDLDFGGTELFIANFGSSQIAVVDLNTQEVSRNITVDTQGSWDGNPYRLVCVQGDRLVFTSEDQWNDLKLVEKSNGARVDNAGSIYQPDLARSPDGARIYAGESGISRSLIMRWEVVNDQLTQVDSYSFGSYTSRIVAMSGDGTVVFYGRHKFLASNLSSDLGTFPEVIYLSNEDGSIAVGQQAIYDATMFSTIRALPVQTTVMALSPDEQTLYLYATSSSKIFLFDMGTLGP